MSPTVAAKEKVLDRIVMARRLGGLYLAEADGMLCGLYEETPAPENYPSPDKQKRYLLGFHECREILRVESLVAAPELVEHPAAHGY